MVIETNTEIEVEIEELRMSDSISVTAKVVTGLDSSNGVDSINGSGLSTTFLQNIEQLRILKGIDDEIDEGIQSVNTVKIIKVILPVL